MTEYTRPATWEDVKALARYLDEAGAEYALAAESDVFADDKRYAIRINDEFTVDVMPSIAGFDWPEMAPHIVSMTIDGTRLQVLDLPF